MSGEWPSLSTADWLGPLITAFLTVVIISVIRKLLHGKDSMAPEESGTIHVSRVLVWGTIILSLMLALLGVVLVIISPGDLVVVIIGLLLTVLMSMAALGSALSLSHSYDLGWDSQGVEGPAKSWSISWRMPRNRIAWGEIAKVDRKQNGVIRLVSKAGNQVIYSQYYANHGLFGATLKSKRPELFA